MILSFIFQFTANLHQNVECLNSLEALHYRYTFTLATFFSWFAYRTISYWAGPYRGHNYSLQNFIKHIFMMFMCSIQLISHVLLCITLDGKMEFIRIKWGATERTFARGYVVVFAICLQSIKITAVVVAKCSFGDISFVLLQSNMENPKTNTEHIHETVFPFFNFFFAQKLFHIQWASVETLFFFSLSRFHSRLNVSCKLIRTYNV